MDTSGFGTARSRSWMGRAARIVLVALSMSSLVRAVPLHAQSSRRTTFGGATAGVAGNIAAADNSFAVVMTMVLRYQPRAVGIEFALPVYQYWSTDPLFGDRTRAAALAPELTLQFTRPLSVAALSLGVGAGWLTSLHDSDLSGPSGNVVAGIRFRVSHALDGRVEGRSRWIEGHPTIEVAAGLEMFR